MYETTHIGLRLNTDVADRLDTARGPITRSAYIRAIIENHLDAMEMEPVEEPEDRSGTGPRTPRRRPRSPDNPFVVVGADDRHLHRYAKTGEPIRYHQGSPIYLRECECGATKEE